ncbi:hypothetical protein BGX29_003622, partial [Mortierella sp. GBA35]
SGFVNSVYETELKKFWAEVRNPILHNPIEQIWSVLKRQLNNRPRKPTSKEEMIAAVLEEWEKIPSETITKL